MTLKIRRVVTGHDAQGMARVAFDELCGNVISRRPNHASCVVWSTGEFPADNGDARDGAAREVATTDPNGTVFRIVEYRPGVAPRNHRTESIDYAVVRTAAGGNAVATLQRLGRNHLLVVEASTAQTPRRVRGVISRSQVERQLGRPIDITPIANSFSEIERALV